MMAPFDETSGLPLFTDARGRPINFKLVCDPVSKARYKKLIEKHSGEVMKCQGRPRLLLATKNICEHLHIGCENHNPYSADPVFRISWVDHCISVSQILDIKAYLLNPNPHFAPLNYMDEINEGRFAPPPSSNFIADPMRCKYSEIRQPFNGAQEHHIREVKDLCSRICRRNAAETATPPNILGASPPSSDEENLEESTMSVMQHRISRQPSSTPRAPPTNSDNQRRPRKSDKLVALPLSRTRTQLASGGPAVSVPGSHHSPKHLQPPLQVSNAEERINVASLASNRPSLSTSRQVVKKNPRRREIFESENFSYRFSDDDSDVEAAPGSLAHQGDAHDDTNRSRTPSPVNQRLSSPPPPARVPTVAANPRSATPESDDEFGPPPGSFVRVRGVRQNTRAPYTREEEVTILRYIKASKKFRGLRSNYIWREMDGKPGLERRTMQSLKEHFIKKMLPTLERFKIFTDDEIKQMRSTAN